MGMASIADGLNYPGSSLTYLVPGLGPRGSVTKEEDPKPSHQLYKLQTMFLGSKV